MGDREEGGQSVDLHQDHAVICRKCKISKSAVVRSMCMQVWNEDVQQSTTSIAISATSMDEDDGRQGSARLGILQPSYLCTIARQFDTVLYQK